MSVLFVDLVGCTALPEGRDAEGVATDAVADAGEAFAGRGYPYHVALTQIDLARWLIDQGRRVEVDPLATRAV